MQFASLISNFNTRPCYIIHLELTACLHMEVGGPGRWGNRPVHIISHFDVITFTC